MSLVKILLLVIISLIIRWVFPGKTRQWAILAVSVLVVYWLQPNLPIRQLDFWLPTATIALVLLSWAITTNPESLKNKSNFLTAGLVVLLLLLISLTRFISFEGILTASRPPSTLMVALVLLLIIGLASVLVWYVRASKTVLLLGVIIILGILIILKTPFLSVQLSISLRYLAAQSTFLARKTDLEWLGFSYLAFRIIHVFIDRRNGRLPEFELRDYFIYTIFFPTFLAGPIDRFQRFKTDLDHLSPINADETLVYSKRLFMGLFKKYILADTLALFALSGVNANQVVQSSWLWVMTLAYSLQLYLDFAGYTDIAIAAAGYLGFRIPENFNQPYLQPNITKFWSAWHITLTQWIRAYFFNPITRYFKSKTKLSSVAVIFIGQMSTMLIIGLWHGITFNFLIWGAWHGLGLFIHNRWSNAFGNTIRARLIDRPKLSALNTALSILATFIFVSVGWIWFTIPNVGLAWDVLLRLFYLR